MKKVKRMLLVAAMSAVTMGAFPQDQGVSAFIPGCYQSYVMAFVDNDAAMEQISIVSTADKVAEMNGRKYKTLDAGEAGLGTLYFRQEGSKVYRLTDDGQGEILCYDFGLKPNEEFTAPDGTEWKVLSARDTAMNLPMQENYKTRLLTLCHKDNPGIQDTWQEGVGSWHYGPFTPDQLQSYASVAMLTCLMDNQVFEFDRPPLWSSFLSHPHSHSSADDEWKMKWMDKDSLTWKQVGDTLHISGFVYGFGGMGGLNARSYIHEGVARVYAVPMPRQSYLLNWYDVDLHVPCHGVKIHEVKVRDVCAQEEMGAQDKYFPQGTKWTELRLDAAEHDSWFTEVTEEGQTKYVPNYEVVEFYVEGDTIDEQGRCYNMVWRDTEDVKHLFSFLLTQLKQGGSDVLALSMFREASFDDMYYPARAYEFEDWEVGKVLRYDPFYYDKIFTGISTPIVCGTIQEIKTGNFGGVRDLEYVDLSPRWTDSLRIIRGIGIASLIKGYRDCLFGLSNCRAIEEYRYEKIMPEYEEEASKRSYRSILVHFERGGEVLYDLWPTPEGGLASHVQGVKAGSSPDGQAVYDLQGRKVEGKPSRGIYVIGGKKRVVR